MEVSSIISVGIETLTVNEDLGEIIIPITRTGNTDLPASVDYSINDDSARSGEDFIGTSSGTLNFAPEETIVEITVSILDDSFPETDESFSLAIGNPTGAVLGGIRTAIITIEDNDVIGEDTLAFSQAEYSIEEAENTAKITVVRNGNTNKTVSVDYATSDDSARAGLDYTAVSGTLTFAPGETTKTFNIPLIDDTLPELNEALTINLSNSVGIDLGLQNTAKLIIEEDDELPFTINREVIVSGLREEGVVFRLSGPTAFDWSRDGTMYIAKIDGIVRVFDGDTLLDEPFIDISDEVNIGGQTGLLGFAVHPDFPEQPYVYLAYSYDPPDVIPDQSGEGRVTRLVRFTADPNSNYRTALPNSEVILLETPPVFNFHAAGAIHFGQDGELFFTHGDGVQVSFSPRPEQAETLQSIDNPFGKLFRIDPITGNGYSDNPFYNGDLTSIESKVYSYGLRNPWRFAIHPETGEPFIGDVGWTNWEEINTGKGNNFGWPLYEGGNGVSLRTTALAEEPEFQNLYATESTVTAPIYAVSHDDGARSITVGDFYTGVAYPEIYQGALFFSDFAQFNNNIGRGVDALTFDAEGNIDSVLNFTDEKWVSQISMGPDSHLYFSNLITGEIGRWVFSSPLPDSPTNGDDFITGTDDDDLLSGEAGDDTLEGNQNSDRLYGGFDNDSLDGGSGNDFLYSGNGNDRAYGGDGNDFIRGEWGDDLLSGEAGDDTLEGNQNSDRLYGGFDNDSLDGGAGNDFLYSGIGNDTAHGGAGNDLLKGEWGDDLLSGGTGADTLEGGFGSDVFAYTSADDSSVNQPDIITDFAVGSDKLLLDFDSFAPTAIGSVSNINEANAYFDSSSIQVAFSLAESVLYVDSSAQGVADMAINLKDVSSLSLSQFLLTETMA